MHEEVFFYFVAKMMLSRIDQSGNGDNDGNSNSGQLLRDIEEISKALYLDKIPRKVLTSPSGARSKSVEKPRLSASRSNLNPGILDGCKSYKDKRSPSAWNWKKPLKALAHIRHQKFNICFSLHVRSIEGLPPNLNDINLSVNWKRKNEVSWTRPSRVLKGIAEFDETLMHKCCVYGSKNGPHHSAKYEVKHFLIYASVVGAPEVDLGKHWVDLTRLLPLTLEELEGEKSTGKWTTSFKLAGKAKGATLNISFGFSVMKGNLIELRRNLNVAEPVNLAHSRRHAVDPITGLVRTNSNGMLRRVESVPSDLNRRSPDSSQSVDLKISDEVSPHLGLELSKSINFLYQKLNDASWHSSEEYDSLSNIVQPLKLEPGLDFGPDRYISGIEHENIEFTVIEQGIEMPKIEHIEYEQSAFQSTDGTETETINVCEIIEDEDNALDGETKFYCKDNIFKSYRDKVLVDDFYYEDNDVCKKGSTIEDLELAFNSLLISESTILEPPLAMTGFLGQEHYMEPKSNYEASKVVKKSHSFDEMAESVATDFLNMLGIEHRPFGLSSDSDPESPRERLLREFEQEALASGNFIIEYGENREDDRFGCIVPAGSGGGGLPEDSDLSLVIQVAEKEHQGASQLLCRRKKAKVLEDLETEALMREWGLSDTLFQSSPRICPDGFGSPVELLPEELYELPALGDGFEPLIQTKGGGCLRSINPFLFRNSKNVGCLIMQVSRPVVLPAEMGSHIMEILQHLASIGIEKLSKLVNYLMPLEDITGRTLQQIAEGATSGATVPDSISNHSQSQATSNNGSVSGQYTFSSRAIAEGFCSGWFSNAMKSNRMDVEMDTEYVTLEDLAPLVVNKIEAMLIEGLRIQSGMAQVEAPSTIRSQSLGKMPAFEGRCADLSALLSSQGVAKLQPLEARDADGDSDELLSLSITLDEWLSLDAGIIGDEFQVSERTIMILAAHHAECMQIINGKLATDVSWDKESGREHGLLGNSITLALRILLRDPHRNYEAVGTPMLALIQLERAIFHPKPKMSSTLLERSTNEEESHKWIHKEEICDSSKEDEQKVEGSPWFKVTEVHLSGLNAESGKMLHWGSKTQQQSGTRWLVASGLCKPYKHPLSKSKAIVVSNPQLMREMPTGDILWSISSHANGRQSTRQDLAAFIPHIRSPDVVFPRSQQAGFDH